MEGLWGEVGDQGGVEPEAIPGVGESFRQEGEGGGSLCTGEGEAGSLKRGVEDLDIAWANAWLPGGMGGTSVIGQEWGNGR